jgi:hypothetical protein
MPHSVTVTSKHYTMGFLVCYGSLKDVFAASSTFVHLYTLCFKEKEKTPAVVTNNTTQAGTWLWFQFIGRLEFSLGQWVI